MSDLRAMKFAAGLGVGVAALAIATPAFGQANWSAARVWDEQTLSAIRIDTPRPPVHARNLYYVSAAMWDAWAAYDVGGHADQVFHHERATAADVEAARAETISYAAYRMLKWRYTNQPGGGISAGAAATNTALDNQFAAMGFDSSNTSTVGNTPAALGNRIYTTIKATGLADGANEAGNYTATNGYAPVNDPLVMYYVGTTMNDPNRWQPLWIAYSLSQNGIPLGPLQVCVCPHWASATPFAIQRTNPTQPYFDPGTPPQLNGTGDATFKADFEQVIQYSGFLDPTDGVTVDISPGYDHNNPSAPTPASATRAR